MSESRIQLPGGVPLHCAVGVDNSAIAAALLNLEPHVHRNTFTMIVQTYNNRLYNCGKCYTEFVESGSVSVVPHWSRGKFRNRSGERGRRNTPLMDQCWPNSHEALCMTCAVGYIPGIIQKFASLSSKQQVQALSALAKTAVANKRDWPAEKIPYAFFLTLTQELIPIIRKRGVRQSRHLTNMMVSCNLLPEN